MPGFWLGIILILFFAVHLQWLPAQSRLGYGLQLRELTGMHVLDSLLTGNLPPWQTASSTCSCLHHPGRRRRRHRRRVLRSSMLEVLRQRLHQAGPLEGSDRVAGRDQARPAQRPDSTVTVVGLQFGVLLGGNMIVETVFGWPGLGRLVVDAIFNRDFPLIQGAVMVYALTFVLVNLVVDVLYTYLNPQIAL